MNQKTKIFLLTAVIGTALAGIFTNGQQIAAALENSGKNNIDGFTTEFFFDKCTWTNTGSNTFFILKPGYQLVLRGLVDGERVELVVTVLDKTKVVDGVNTRVVEERESVDGKLAEISRNYFAVCKQTSSVAYFGEDVDMYDDAGKNIVSHEGAWLAGQHGNKPGIIMPGTVLLGSKYFQEIAPDVAMDRAQIVSLDAEVETRAGEFEEVLKIKETTPLEPSAVEFKYHAEGIGLIQDAELKLVRHGFVS